MKRKVTIIVAAILVLAFASVAAAASVTLSGSVVKENFSNFQEQINLGWDGNFGAWGGNLSGTFADNFTIDNGSLKVTYPAGQGATFTVNVPLPAKEHKAASWHVNNQGADASLRFIVADSSNYIQISAGEKAYLVPDSGEASEVVVEADDVIVVPAGFVGKVVLPFASFKTGSDSWKSFNDVLAIEADAVGFQVKFNSTAAANSVIKYDDITFYTGVQTGAAAEESGDDANNENPKTGDFGAAYYVIAALGASGVLVGLKHRNRK